MSEVNAESDDNRISQTDSIPSSVVMEQMDGEDSSVNVYDLSNAADIMVKSIMARVTKNYLSDPSSGAYGNRSVSPFPGGNLMGKRLVRSPSTNQVVVPFPSAFPFGQDNNEADDESDGKEESTSDGSTSHGSRSTPEPFLTNRNNSNGASVNQDESDTEEENPPGDEVPDLGLVMPDLEIVIPDLGIVIPDLEIEIPDSDSPPPPETPIKEQKFRAPMPTSVSLDRIKEIIDAEKHIEIESETDESDEDVVDEIPINARPRSASVGHLVPPADVADPFPRGQPLTERSHRDHYSQSDRDLITILGPGRNLNIWIGTWNLNLSTDVNLAQLKNFLNIQSATRKDVYIFGCQEMLVEGIFDWEVGLQKCLGRKYILLHAVRFGTIHLAIFIRHELQGKCSTVDWGVLSVRAISQIKTKGVAACALQIFGTKFLFMNSHFAAGEGERNLANRVRNFITITKKLRLRRSKTVLERKKNSLSIVEKKYPLDFNDFDCTFWFGDLNFRLCSQSGEDELTACIKRQLCFNKFSEQKINFMPTYKFNPGTRIYDTSKTLRQPSYTDRILYQNRVAIKPLFYNSYPELDHSDHRPVAAIFQVQLRPLKPCNAPVSVNNGEFVVSVYKSAFRDQPTLKSRSQVCQLL